MMPLKGWIPETKHESFLNTIVRILKREKYHILLYKKGIAEPYNHHKFIQETDWGLYTPEMLQYHTQTNVTDRFFKSLHKGGFGGLGKSKWIIIIIIVIAAGVIAKMTGIA